MKRLLAVIFLALILFVVYWIFFKGSTQSSSPKQEAIKVKKHSDDFNRNIANTVNRYIDLKNAFVDMDTNNVKLSSQRFINSMDTINLTELSKDDSTIMLAAQQEMSDIKANASALLMENDLVEMQQDFRMVSENLYPFLKTVGYEGQRLYWQSCATAFGENREGNWLSTTREIINPYVNKNTPKTSQANCGELKDSIQ
ncbi:MAG: DUF3347 domain-containing protein [Bacteroidota bacterium]|nr:DUF3347 domain-containing protein [Bacteroidota bacterium]